MGSGAVCEKEIHFLPPVYVFVPVVFSFPASRRLGPQTRSARLLPSISISDIWPRALPPQPMTTFPTSPGEADRPPCLPSSPLLVAPAGGGLGNRQALGERSPGKLNPRHKSAAEHPPLAERSPAPIRRRSVSRRQHIYFITRLINCWAPTSLLIFIHFIFFGVFWVGIRCQLSGIINLKKKKEGGCGDCHCHCTAQMCAAVHARLRTCA